MDKLKLLATADGSFTVYSNKYQQAYHSSMGAAAEADALYIKASGFAEKISISNKQVNVLDVGLGLGYNVCSTINTWSSSKRPSSIKILSLENDRDIFLLLNSGQALWQEKWQPTWLAWVKSLALDESKSFYTTTIKHPTSSAICCWEVLLGDAQSLLIKNFNEYFDFIWQDPFSVDVNPELWTKRWFNLLRVKCNRDAKLISYSVARKVKDNLENSGWIIQKIPALGRKKSWLRATIKIF